MLRNCTFAEPKDAGGIVTTFGDVESQFASLASGRIANMREHAAIPFSPDDQAANSDYSPGHSIQYYERGPGFGHSRGGTVDIRYFAEQNVGILVLTNRSGRSAMMAKAAGHGKSSELVPGERTQLHGAGARSVEMDILCFRSSRVVEW